jgi:hypothetical protein
MRVLLQIPKNPPPQLVGNYSKLFREFIEACLQKNPEHVCGIKKRGENDIYLFVLF